MSEINSKSYSILVRNTGLIYASFRNYDALVSLEVTVFILYATFIAVGTTLYACPPSLYPTPMSGP